MPVLPVQHRVSAVMHSAAVLYSVQPHTVSVPPAQGCGAGGLRDVINIFLQGQA